MMSKSRVHPLIVTAKITTDIVNHKICGICYKLCVFFWNPLDILESVNIKPNNTIFTSTVPLPSIPNHTSWNDPQWVSVQYLILHIVCDSNVDWRFMKLCRWAWVIVRYRKRYKVYVVSWDSLVVTGWWGNNRLSSHYQRDVSGLKIEKLCQVIWMAISWLYIEGLPLSRLNVIPESPLEEYALSITGMTWNF